MMEQTMNSTLPGASPISEFCTRNDICRDKAYAEIRAGRLIARKIGKRTVILHEDEARWRENLPVLSL
jgi:hypothetical protein